MSFSLFTGFSVFITFTPFSLLSWHYRCSSSLNKINTPRAPSTSALFTAWWRSWLPRDSVGLDNSVSKTPPLIHLLHTWRVLTYTSSLFDMTLSHQQVSHRKYSIEVMAGGWGGAKSPLKKINKIKTALSMDIQYLVGKCMTLQLVSYLWGKTLFEMLRTDRCWAEPRKRAEQTCKNKLMKRTQSWT